MAISSYGTGTFAAAPIQAALTTNYIDFATGSGVDWSQQYLPDLMEKEVDIFGNRTISGFLAQVGAEEAMSSDQVVWSEQGRLHLTYTCQIQTASSGLVEIQNDVDGNSIGANHGIRVGDQVLLAKAGTTTRGYVAEISLDSSGSAATSSNQFITVLPYAQAELGTNTLWENGDNTCRIMVYGSEHAKGTTGKAAGNKPQHKSHTNKPVIMKDLYEISGSDASQIGWVEVAAEDGTTGYLWYLKAEAETRARFADYLEMTMIESAKGDSTSEIHDHTGGLGSDTNIGTEGLFSAIETRGHVTTGVTGVNAATDLAEFDDILAKFDENGAIEENMMFVNRDTALAIDDMLASMNSYGAGGTSYGVFNNSEDMALNLGFSGFRRGSYDFYKSDWKYLNDKATRGFINALDTTNAVRGTIIPAGVSSVYDQVVGKNMKRPFLHVRYRASQTESRKMKTWVTGSVGAVTSDLDAMQIHMLSERCLVVQGGNNFMLMK
tara:strand:+ start:4169 stop:5647 length:1479 start_codon:yes stop_codon:yes gene_type:complete